MVKSLLNIVHTESLLLAAEVYLSLGYSVIPLYGDADPARPKVAAIPWSMYQSRRASLSDARYWFVEQGFQGIGIITGRISNLVVLDFDDPQLFLTFSKHYPHLVELEVLQTRRGYHIYYHLPPSLYVPTRKGQGIDLLSNGCYAVARPTTIAGLPYQLIRGGAPRLLTAPDLADITTFLDHHASRSVPAPAQPAADVPAPVTVLAPGDLQALYRTQVGQGRGRNQSLFNVACTARDHGFAPADVLSLLADLHVHMSAFDQPPRETERQRHQEAVRTLQSAFSRPPRPPRPITIPHPQLPTRAREALYALKLTCVVRLIEGLREKGVQPGQSFTRKQARLLLLGIVGRDSIDHALHAVATSGQPLVERAATPSDHPPASNDAADENHLPEFKKCFFERISKSGKIQSGRKSHTYTMPTNAQLCHRLGVRFSSSDPLYPDDLTSAKKTRQAAHREFIRRRPGQYPRRWLAKRLSVSVSTTRRYDHALHMQVRPMYAQHLLTASNLILIPDFPLDGTFLQDENQRRYPAKQEIAARLLNKGHTLVLMRQQANFYRLDPPSVASVPIGHLQQARRASQERLEQRIAVEQGRAETLPLMPFQPPALPRSGLPPPEPAPSLPLPDLACLSAPPKVKPTPRLTKRRARQPLPDRHQEALAQRVYRTVNDRTTDRRDCISLATARRCVVTYGVKSVESALRLVQSRRNITKPAGFLVSILRSEHNDRRIVPLGEHGLD